MAWWLTVYCRRPVSRLTAKQLQAGITGEDATALAGVDYFTLAEDYDVADELVSPAMKALKVSKELQVSFGDSRPIVVHVWSSPERVAEELSEVQEVRTPPKSLRSALKDTKEIVGIELGFSHLENMGVVIAYELARYLAQKGDGVIVDDDDRWQRIDDGAFSEID
ncbi:MAG: hypothetical protein GQE15_35260 [Archangiaceae bacterium]|nr:hypothetical protein [Archangiaceae bacterium]